VIAQRLVEAGLLQASGLAKVLEIQARDGGTIGRIAANLGLAREEDVARWFATHLRMGFLALDRDQVGSDAVGILPEDFCRKRRIVPVRADGGRLDLAVADPLDLGTLQDVEFRTGRWVTPIIATESAILDTLRALFPEVEEAGAAFDLIQGAGPQGVVEESTGAGYEVTDPSQLARDVKQPPIVRLVNLILTDAAKSGASDVHIEPQENSLHVRHRLDGLLVDILRVPRHLQDAVISRMKIISGMDIAERRKPQDGRTRLRLEQRRIDLRVSTLPTNFGEKVVVRLLDAARACIEIDRLEMTPEILRRWNDLLARPQGMLLVTGPTGSGKTSTLYASFNAIKSRAKNLITVEDPIEFQIPGVSQVQINTRGGVTFAAGLRSILRQDPDIVMVGEIRDQETAAIAAEAAETGHLLLSTVHTNDAIATITRFVDLGVEPFLVASSLLGILAQRLLRRVCEECAVERAPGAAARDKFAVLPDLPEGARWRAGRGCPVCRQSGYRGRMAIHELLVVSDAMREMIARRAPEQEMRAAARGAGMRSMMEDGIAKAARGLTTLEEVLRVAPHDETLEARDADAPGTPAPGPAPIQAPAPVGADGAAGRGTARILVVEDSVTVVTVVRYFLELEGFEVEVASDGNAGLEAARRRLPDVVVSDVNMPGMDGLALTRALREGAATRGVGIILLTSETGVDIEARGLEIGADDFIAKPVEPRRLVARVKAILGRARGRLQEAA